MSSWSYRQLQPTWTKKPGRKKENVSGAFYYFSLTKYLLIYCNYWERQNWFQLIFSNNIQLLAAGCLIQLCWMLEKKGLVRSVVVIQEKMHFSALVLVYIFFLQLHTLWVGKSRPGIVSLQSAGHLWQLVFHSGLFISEMLGSERSAFVLRSLCPSCWLCNVGHWTSLSYHVCKWSNTAACWWALFSYAGGGPWLWLGMYSVQISSLINREESHDLTSLIAVLWRWKVLQISAPLGGKSGTGWS